LTARIELVPTLEHCIETTARQEFSRSADAYMQQGEGDRKLEQRIELLRAFLETADFKKLRRESEKHLAEGKRPPIHTREHLLLRLRLLPAR